MENSSKYYPELQFSGHEPDRSWARPENSSTWPISGKLIQATYQIWMNFPKTSRKTEILKKKDEFSRFVRNWNDDLTWSKDGYLAGLN